MQPWVEDGEDDDQMSRGFPDKKHDIAHQDSDEALGPRPETLNDTQQPPTFVVDTGDDEQTSSAEHSPITALPAPASEEEDDDDYANWMDNTEEENEAPDTNAPGQASHDAGSRS
jgi:hypothetical protein